MSDFVSRQFISLKLMLSDAMQKNWKKLWKVCNNNVGFIVYFFSLARPR